ncbi:MAG TPA: chorismate synthase [Candidatus Ozemobacteraceae bacterium]|nr:chorismate synthase [Candidatus Ozemobacteraceae bacterium]
MSNSFGKFFRVTTWGESHGPALGAVIDGCPAGLSVEDDDIREQLDRDVPDRELGTPRGEINRFQILSGVFEGKTLGTPISIIVWNNDARPRTYSGGRDTLRPGHADFTWLARYGHTDWRGGSRASGRECIARLVAGAVARKLAASVGVRLTGRVVELAGLPVTNEQDYAVAKLRALEIAGQGDSTGGVIEVLIEGMPPGVGNPVFGKLQADLAAAFLSIGGVKGLETGEGFAAARMRGSLHNDPFALDEDGRVVSVSNRCGGLLGGISTGDRMSFRLAVKPTPTIQRPQQTVNVVEGKPVCMEYNGRFDANYAPRVVPIAEAMAACVITDHLICSGFMNPARHGSVEPITVEDEL